MNKISDQEELMREWNFNKNTDIKPENVSTGSHKVVWWKCKNGHEWEDVIRSRAIKGYGCPYCNHKRPIKKVNDLGTLFPELIMEWDYDKNGDMLPENYLSKSNEIKWWKCKNNHEWKARINNRTRGRNCPYCAGKKVVIGKTDLKSCFPDLAKEWSYEKNGVDLPNNYTAYSSKKVWWKCNKGHFWISTIKDRTYGTKCPYCAKKRVIKGENDLAKVCPSLVDEWNIEKNIGISINEVSAQSNRKVWWKCKEYGHEWKAAIYSRKNGKGCPYCSGRLAIRSVNDLMTVNPDLAREWNYLKNGNLEPTDFKSNSNKRVWWSCKYGHNWKASIDHRNKGTGCPLCAKSLRQNYL